MKPVTQKPLASITFALVLALAWLWAVGWALAGPRLALLFPLGGLVFVLLMSMWVVRRLDRQFRGCVPPTEGLEQSFMRALSERPLRRPVQLEVYASPSPNAAMLRAPLGATTIRVSQGLLSVLSESDLRAVLAECAMRAEQPRLALRTLCAAWADLLLSLAPSAWVSMLFSDSSRRDSRSGRPAAFSPASAFFFVLVFPAARAFLRASHAAQAEPDPMLGLALQRLDRANRMWSAVPAPGASFLHLVVPTSVQKLA